MGYRSMPKPSEKEVFKRDRSRFWQLRYTSPDGTEIRRSSGTEDYDDAVRQLQALKEGSAITVEELIVRFFEEHGKGLSPSTIRCYKGSFRRWDPFIGRLNILEVKEEHIRKFVSSRLKEITQPSLRIDLAALSSLMRFARMLPGGPTVNPVKMFDKSGLRKSEERVKYLAPDQVKALMEAIGYRVFQLMAQLAMEAGLRKGEILNLQMRELHMYGPEDTHHILLPNTRTKTGQGRSVPMSRALSRALAAHIREFELRPSDRVFTNPATRRAYYGVQPWFTDACTRIGLEDFHFHDLRHHFASTYVQKGGRLFTLSELMGHKSSQMTSRYAHLAPGDAAREFRRLDDT